MPMRSRDVNRRRSVGSAVSERIADRRAFDVLGWASMIPYRYGPRRMFNLLRVGLYEVRDGLAKRFPRRLPAVVDYNPDADICGAFAECLRRNGFPEHAEVPSGFSLVGPQLIEELLYSTPSVHVGNPTRRETVRVCLPPFVVFFVKAAGAVFDFAILPPKIFTLMEGFLGGRI